MSTKLEDLRKTVMFTETEEATVSDLVEALLEQGAREQVSIEGHPRWQAPQPPGRYLVFRIPEEEE